MSEPELEPLITACPNCGTRFRVTEAQLAIASGKVRCGACLSVFQGVEHLIWEQAYDDDRQADSALDEVLNALANTQEMPQVPDSEAPSLTDTQEVAAARHLSQNEAEEILAAIGRTFELKDDGLAPVDVPWRAAPGFPEPTTGDFPEVGDLPAADTVPDAVEQPWSGAGSAPAASETAASDPAAEREPEPADATAEAAPEALVEESPAERRSEPSGESSAVPITAPGALAARLELPVEDSLADAEAWTFDTEPEPSRPLWLKLAILAAALALVVQLFWYQFDRWSRDPLWRPVYSAACTVLGCVLPARQNLDLIVSRRLVVRSHPDQADALMVDALIMNDAPFEQPFPVIELSFSDLQQNLVAQRRFRPEEYLAGELASRRLMEPKQPVRIAFEISDPGPTAENYFLRFR